MANMNFGVNILPKANNTYTLGNSDYKWNIFANTINGINLTNIITDVQINGTSILSNNIANIPIATKTTPGVVMVGAGVTMAENKLWILKATNNHIKNGAEDYCPIVPASQHRATFYGLAKAAGDSTQSASSNAVGTYTDSAKTAIRSMLGISQTIGIANVSDYGAVGDGITDDSAAIQAACNANYDVYFESNKTYYLASTITLTHDIRLHGGENTIIQTKTANNTVITGIRINGTLKKTTTLTSNYISKGTGDNCDNRFTLSDMTDIDIGDILVIEAEDQYYSYARQYYHLGGTVVVTDIYDNHLYTCEAFPWDITNTENVSVKVYDAPVVTIENIHFISDLNSIGAYSYLLDMAKCKNSNIINCTFSNMANGLRVEHCVNTKIDNINLAKSKYDNTLNGDGYGILVDSCTNTIIERVLATCAQHAIDISGHLPTLNTWVRYCNLTAECRQPGFDTHESVYNLIIEDCILGGASVCGTVKINRCKIINNRRVSNGQVSLVVYGSQNKNYANFTITNCEFIGTDITLYHLVPQDPVTAFDTIFDKVEIDNCKDINQINLSAANSEIRLSHTVNHLIIKNSNINHIYNEGQMVIKELILDNVTYSTSPVLSDHNSTSMVMSGIQYFDYKRTNPMIHKIRVNRSTYGESLILPGDAYIELSSNNENAKFIVCGENIVSDNIEDYHVGIIGGSAGGNLSRSVAGSGAPTIAFNSDGDMVYTQGSGTGQYCVYPIGLVYIKESMNITFSTTLYNTGTTNGSKFIPFIVAVDGTTGKVINRYSGSAVTATSEGINISYNRIIGSGNLIMCYLYCNSPVSGAETTFRNYHISLNSNLTGINYNTNQKFIAKRLTGNGTLTSLPGINNILCSELSFNVNIYANEIDNRIPLVTENKMGLMTYEDKVKLDSIITMTGATSSIAGASGLVPAPATTDVDKFLAGDGTYKSGGLPMVILSYGSSTWNDFINAYNNNVIVYCRASSNSNPATGSQTRMAFMAYVNNATTPTEVEFQYYRSMSSHSATAMGDQVFVYKLTKTGGWSVTTRDASIKQIKADTGTALGVSWSSNVVTLTNTMTADDMPMSSSDATTAKAAIDGKININQGVANAGKFLVVNSSGNVEAITLQEWQGGNY